MKKFLLFVLLFVAVQVSAQEFHIIPKVGLNMANISNSDGSMKPGLNIGVAGEIKLNEIFAVEPGIFYSMQGTKSSEDEYSMKYKLDYLNVPIYAKAYLYKGLFAFAGPQFGFNLAAKVSGSDSDVSASVDMKDMIKTFDCAIGIGVGYQSELGLMISANYNIGVTNIVKESDEESSRNGVLQINLGWRF